MSTYGTRTSNDYVITGSNTEITNINFNLRKLKRNYKNFPTPVTDSTRPDRCHDGWLNSLSKSIQLRQVILPSLIFLLQLGQHFGCAGLFYKALPKHSGNLTIKKFLTATPNFHRLLRSSPLGHVSSDPSVFHMIWSIPGSFQMCVVTSCDLRGSPQSCQNDALSTVISSLGIGKSRRGRGQTNWGGITVMFLEVRNCRTTSDVWAGALSCWRNQLLFFHLSGRLRRMPSLSRFKTSH